MQKINHSELAKRLILRAIENYRKKFILEEDLMSGEDKRKVLEELEKQFKEIEKLKENNGYHLGFIDGGIAKKYEYQDKIKAKIEEVKDGTYDAKIVLQSLLEKE